MAWINIHSFNFLVNSDYGQILIIKLVSIVPLIILGAYHQLKLHNTIVNIASLRENDSNNNIDKRNIIDLKNSKKNLKTKQEQTESNKINIFKAKINICFVNLKGQTIFFLPPPQTRFLPLWTVMRG